jgi:hypothetical protein
MREAQRTTTEKRKAKNRSFKRCFTIFLRSFTQTFSSFYISARKSALIFARKTFFFQQRANLLVGSLCMMLNLEIEL